MYYFKHTKKHIKNRWFLSINFIMLAFVLVFTLHAQCNSEDDHTSHHHESIDNKYSSSNHDNIDDPESVKHCHESSSTNKSQYLSTSLSNNLNSNYSINIYRYYRSVTLSYNDIINISIFYKKVNYLFSSIPLNVNLRLRI